MSATVSITLDDIYTDLGTFIMATLGLDANHVVQEFNNRVAMPTGPFVGMRLTTNKRLRTNEGSWIRPDPSADPPVPFPTTYQIEQGIMLNLQLDCYAPQSGDWATILSTLLRDDVGCVALAPTCQPLYADNPVRAPLVDGEEQYEDRWIVNARLQYNPVVSTPQDFADTLAIDLHNVDVEFPP